MAGAARAKTHDWPVSSRWRPRPEQSGQQALRPKGIMLLRRLLATTTGAVISKGAAIITALLLFRQLPAADMGRYTAALTLVGFCAIVGNTGLNPLTTREIARRGRGGWAWWAALVPLRLLLALGAYGLLVVVALFVP